MMPVKFKIYYSVVIYVLLWAVGWLGYIGYMSIMKPLRGSEWAGVIIIATVLLLCVVKTVTSLAMLRHLKNTTQPGKAGRVFFIVFFAINILFVLLDGVAIWGIVEIIFRPVSYDVQHSYPTPQVSVQEWLVFISVIVAGVAGILMAVFDLLLLKAIKNNYHDTMLSFEANATE